MMMPFIVLAETKHSTAPGNLRGAKKHHDTIRGMMATSSHVFSSISRGGTQ
jgi:hypothetical protein